LADHPYRNLPPAAFWRREVAERRMEDVDPVIGSKFRVLRADKIVTAGSCFAQHISRYLSQSGFHYLVTEPAHPLLARHVAESYNYGVFTARYANIYTSRQMLQTLQRAYGLFQPTDDVWIEAEETILDPYRPSIQPGGFSTMEEFRADRAQHFAAVRRAVETLDCFVFTLGLTECCMSRNDGAVYPLCPGVSGGRFDGDLHRFHNLTFGEVIEDLTKIRAFIQSRNPGARFILTVSPVPLIATASGAHVLTATTMSKSVLRAAAGEFAASREDVVYFPSYEIITGSYARGRYFDENLRDVTAAGVAHVMRLFLLHCGEVGAEPAQRAEADVAFDTEALIRSVCEEEALRRFE
jgi:hypothetical protein